MSVSARVSKIYISNTLVWHVKIHIHRSIKISIFNPISTGFTYIIMSQVPSLPCNCSRDKLEVRETYIPPPLNAFGCDIHDFRKWSYKETWSYFRGLLSPPSIRACLQMETYWENTHLLSLCLKHQNDEYTDANKCTTWLISWLYIIAEVIITSSWNWIKKKKKIHLA